MTTMEHLFMQIFDRRRWIEEQLRQQIDSYGQSLACNVIADGGRPPEWLLNTGSGACWYPEPRGIALSQPWDATPKTNNCILNTLPLKNTALSYSNAYVNHITNDNVHIEDIDRVMPKSHRTNDKRDLHLVSTDVAEPFNEFDSFTTVQRSKSRQRDLENRLSNKTEDAHLVETTVEQSSDRMMSSKFTSTKSNNAKESLGFRNSDCSNRDTIKAAFKSQTAQDVATVSSISNLITSKSSTGNCLAKSIDQTAVGHALASPVSASLSRAHFVVMAKELSFDDNEASHPSKNQCDAYPGEKGQSYNFKALGGDSVPMESLKDDSSCRDSGFGSSQAIQLVEDVFDTQVPKTTGIAQISVRTPSQNLAQKVDNLQFHSRSDSGNKILQIPSPIPNYIDCGTSSEKQSGQCLPNVLTSILGRRQSVTASLADDNPSDKLEQCELKMEISAAHQKEAEDGNCGISVSMVKTVQYMRDEPFCRNAETVLHSSSRQLHSGDVSHAAEATHMEKAQSMLLGHDKAKDQLLAMETKTSCLSGPCNSGYSHIPLQYDSSLTSERAHTVSSLPGRRHIEESTSSYVQSNGAMTLTVETEKILTKDEKTENVGVNVVSETCAPLSLTTDADKDYSPRLECGPLMKSSISTHSTSGASGSESCSLPCSTDANDVFVPKHVNHAGNEYLSVNFFVHESPKSSVVENKVKQTDCHSTRLSGFCGSFDSGKENKMISSSALPETTKKSFSQASEECTEKEMGHMVPKSKSEPTKARYFLRSLNSNEKSISTSKLNALPEITKKSDSQASEDCTENEMELVPLSNINSKTEPSKPRYFLRSLSSNDESVSTSKLNASISAPRSMQSFGIIKHSYETSWPKRRKIVYHSSNVLATSPRMRVNQHMNTNVDVQCTSKESSEATSAAEVQIQLSTYQTEMNSGSPLEIVDQSMKRCLGEVVSCPRNEDQTETLQGVTSPLVVKNINTCPLNEIRVDESTSSTSEEHCISDDFHDLSVPDNELNNVASTSCNIQSSEQTKVFDTQNIPYTYDQSRLLECNVDFAVSCDETMPEFEGFSIGVSPIREEGIFYNSDSKSHANEEKFTIDELKASAKLFSPKSRPSGKYKINKLSDIFRSLPTGISEQINTKNILDFDDGCAENSWKLKDPCDSGMESAIYSSFPQMSSSFSTPYTGARFAWEGTKLPLTPIEKSSFKKVSVRSDDTERVGSDLELVCFRIDEDTCSVEEDEHLDEIDISQSNKISGVKASTNRKPLLDVTTFYENMPIVAPPAKKFLERDSLETVDTSTYSRVKMNNHSSWANASTCKRDSKRDEENQLILDNGDKDLKKAQSLHPRSVNLEMKSKAGERNRSQGIPSKGCKPKNIVSSITSFIPLVQKKQQVTPAKGKKDIKVKALEAAEAAKKLEEKKQNEREMRKAALKLERTRLEQEKQLKQKQKDVEKKRKQEDMAARKRQREEEQQKEKERKRKCTEESRRLQVEQDTQLNSKKDMGFYHQGTHEGKQKKDIEVESNQQPKEVKGQIADVTHAAEVGTSISKVVNALPVLKVVQDRLSTTEENQDPQSYEMSPCKDSDDDEDDEEERIRGRKYVPTWARRECLHKILLSKLHLDPTEIFSSKSSFNLSEVLCHQVVRRPL